MGNTTCQRPDRLHLLGLQQLCFQFAVISHVYSQTGTAGHSTVSVLQERIIPHDEPYPVAGKNLIFIMDGQFAR